jgi:phosphonate transport system substrate-binding protein
MPARVSRQRFIRRVLPGAALATAAVIAACGSDDAPKSATNSTAQPQAPASKGKLTIAVQPTATQQQLATDAKDIEKFLSEKTGREIELIFPTSFAGVIEALRFGHAHAAFMSAWPAALAQKHAGAEVVLAEVREVVIGEKLSQEPFYFSYWVVKSDSSITSMEQLRGKKVSLPSNLSTSGYVAPMARMVELGYLPAGNTEVDPKKFFSDVLFSGGYAQSWEALKAGQVDATVIAGDVSEKLYREVLAGTRVLEQQGPIPSHGVVFAKQLQGADREQLKAAMLELGTPERRDLMRKFISGIFISFKATTTEEHLASLNRYLQATQLQFVERLK